jgi:hypothetical protein
MHDHQVEGHRQSRLETMHHHAKRIAHQDEIDVAIGNRRGMRVIGGKRHDGLTAFASEDLRRGYAVRGLLNGHEFQLTV